MRKCDICSTMIPFGEDRCPKCGFPYKPERQLSAEVHAAKKEKYMAQFQQHPSPLDHLKKGEIPDFSKVYNSIKDTFNKPTIKSVQPNKRKKNGKALLIIPILIIFVIIGAVTFGISYGFSQIFDEIGFIDFENFFNNFDDSDFYDEDYVWYHSGKELEDAYPEIYAEVKPYRMHIYNYILDTASDDTMTEMYSVEYGELSYASIDAPILINDVDVWAMIYYQDGEWYELYQANKEIGRDASLIVDQNVINALGYLTRVDTEVIQGFLEDYLQQYREGYTYKYMYSDDGGTFYFTYDDGFIHYEYENFIEVTE